MTARYPRTEVFAGETFPVAPVGGRIEAGLIELIGADEEVAQNKYGGSAAVALASTCSGVIESLVMVSREAGTGDVQTPAGTLYFLDADPSAAVGDAALAFAEWATVIGSVDVLATHWDGDANGKAVFFNDVYLPFHSLSTLYVVWLHKSATSFNDGAGDNETLHVNFWYRLLVSTGALG